jgi:hypothetical protein
MVRLVSVSIVVSAANLRFRTDVPPPHRTPATHGHGVVVAVDIGGRVWLFGPTPEMIRMSFATLAVISLVAIIGPLLALPRRWHLPVILGELVAGIVLGTTGSGACRRTTRRSRCWLTLGSR